MKKLVIIAYIFVIMTVLAAGVSAAETEAAVGAVESEIVETVDELDKTLSGVELWETAKAWVIENLSTISGVLVAISTFVIGLATKFSFVPKILTAFKSLFTSMKGWYSDNIEQLKIFRGIIETFTSDMRETISVMKAQAQENNDLRKELLEARQANNKALEENTRLKEGLIRATLLQCDELQDLIQTSPLPTHELNKHEDAYQAKRAAVIAILEGDNEA